MNSVTTTRKFPAWPTLFGIALFGLVIFSMNHVLAQYRWADIVAHAYAIPTAQLLRAAGFAIAGYSILTLYDFLGTRFACAQLPYPRVALISFMACAIGHNVGFNMLSGGAIRLRGYGVLGLNAAKVATIIAFGTLTFALGVATLLGTSLLFEAESASILGLPAAAIRLLGAVLLVAVLSYVGLTWRRRAPLKFRRFEIPIPKTRFALAQIAISCGDLLCAAGVLYALLPEHNKMGFVAFAGIYLMAIAAGVISNLPGGVGVFELVLLLLLRGLPRDQLLGVLLVYRAIYYLAPLAIALLLLGLHELSVHRGPLARVAKLAKTYLNAFTPQGVAIAVFGAGSVLVFSGATPGLSSRLVLLREIIPLPVLELSHLLGSVVGVGLMILANGLYRRLDAAWWLTIWLLCAGVMLSLLKGFDYEEALSLSIIITLLISARARFQRRASLLEQNFSFSWIAAVLLVLGTSVWLVMFAYRHIPYSHELWWQFAFEAPAPRSLRALMLAVVTAAAYGLWRLLRPAALHSRAPSPADLVNIAAVLSHTSDTTANLALLGDKNLLFNEDRSAFIMYQASGSSWVSMGDPIGPEKARESLAWRFLELCDAKAVEPVFYQVTPENLPLYIDLGLNLSKLGEEARVPLATFSLEGGARAELRQAHRRAIRDGAQFEVVPRARVGEILPQLRAISDSWLENKEAAEKRFSMGFFADDYLSNFDCAIVRLNSNIVAFANIWRAGASEELSVDLMRYNNEAPKGVIDYLLIEVMLWGRDQKFAWFNLGMAPLAGLEEHALAPTWHKLGRMVQRYGENFYPFEGLRKFKEKFVPIWRPRYLAAPGGLAMAGVLLDVTALIAGGVGKVLRK